MDPGGVVLAGEEGSDGDAAADGGAGAVVDEELVAAIVDGLVAAAAGVEGGEEGLAELDLIWEGGVFGFDALGFEVLFDEAKGEGVFGGAFEVGEEHAAPHDAVGV